MTLLLNLLGSAAALGMLVCYIMVVVKTFQNGRTGAAIAQIVTFFLCCIGMLVSLIYGWTKAETWRIKNLMIVYTACFLVYLGVAVITGPAQYKLFMEQVRIQQERQQGAPVPAQPFPAQPVPVAPEK